MMNPQPKRPAAGGRSPQVPQVRPGNPAFSSGPCAKRPGWSLAALEGAAVGRSHRSAAGKAKLAEAIELSRRVLRLPDTHRLGIVPGSNTGAFEMAMWSLLGARPVDMLAWDSFGQDWVQDIQSQLRLKETRLFDAPYGALPPLDGVDFAHDVVFVWNGTTSGVCLPHADWIAPEREGLTLCDATSAAFAVELDWARLDVVTFSWQKVLGGEGAHGMLALSERACERLASWTPPWPLPKIFRLTKKGALDEALFGGSTINTPSLLAVEDYLDALRWAQSAGGLEGLRARVRANQKVLDDWVAQSDWVEFLCAEPAWRSPTSPCLRLGGERFGALDAAALEAQVRAITGRLAAEGVAYDIANYRAAPPGFRIWTGATVEADDVRALTHWLDWAKEAAA